MCHPRYCLTYHPGISSATQTSHLSAPPTLPTLASNPRHPHQDVTHASTPPTLARHQCKHTTHASRSPTQAHHLRHPRQRKKHAISQTPGYPIGSQIPRENLAVFTFSFYFYTLLFRSSSQNLEETSLPYSKHDYFFKNKCLIFLEKTVS